jgi:hypothetical protein
MPKKTFQVQLSLAERARLQMLVTNGSATAHTHILRGSYSKPTKAQMGQPGQTR